MIALPSIAFGGFSGSAKGVTARQVGGRSILSLKCFPTGVLGAGAPKVFFRYYFVNSATGEKSGIMLASVTWTAGE